MSRYYLIAQLPSLDNLNDNAPVPISEEIFLELCERFLSKKLVAALKEISLIPNRNALASGYKIIDKWNAGETALREALAFFRAQRMGKSYEAREGVISDKLLSVADRAVNMESPLEAEKYLSKYRYEFLEDIRPSDAFSEEAVIFYLLKLKLALRMKFFDENKGREVYRKIYDAVINSDSRGKSYE